MRSCPDSVRVTRCSQWSYRRSVCGFSSSSCCVASRMRPSSIHCHHCQGRADPGVYRDRHHRVQGRRLRRQLLGRCRVLDLLGGGPGNGHDAHRGIRVPGNRGRERLLTDARKREDVGRATVIGFLSVLSVFAMVTLVSYGVMPQGELAGVSQPSMAAVLESIVGPWGSIFVRVGVIVSVLGAYLAWTLMAAEVLYIPAKTDDMPRFLARTNIHGARVSALIMAAGLISLLLVALLFAADALDFVLDLTAALSLIPYLLAAAYALKLTATRETYEDGRSITGDMIIAAVATF